MADTDVHVVDDYDVKARQRYVRNAVSQRTVKKSSSYVITVAVPIELFAVGSSRGGNSGVISCSASNYSGDDPVRAGRLAATSNDPDID